MPTLQKKKNLFGTKTFSSNKSWNKMRGIQSRDREDSNITPQSVPQRKVLSPSTLSVFCSGIAYSCPKPSMFLSKGNNFLMCLRSWISMWKHNFQDFFIRKMEFYIDFFFFQKWLLQKNANIFWKAVNWIKLMRFSFFIHFQAMNTLVLKIWGKF